MADQLAPDVANAIGSLALAWPHRVFSELAPSPPSTGVIGLALRPAVDARQLLAWSDRPLVVLEWPRHLGNVGAVVRVAAAANAAGVLVVGDVDPFHPTAVRGAAGLQFALPCARVDRLGTTDRPIIALQGGGAELPGEGLPSGAIVAFGTERDGLGAELSRRADASHAIPMRSGVSSLNLATAVAVTLYIGFGRG
ncbi:MAG: TrmH family RNA methyltransferase [Pseudomonadota bacterium]